MDLLKEFYRVADDPCSYVRELKEEGKRIIGYFCSYTPEEILFASGAHPMRLFGTKGDISLADAHLQAYSCSLIRGALEEALSGKLDFLDGAVFPHTCDSIQRLSDIWRLNTGFAFFADVVLPVKLNTESARQYMVDVLQKFRRDLETGLGLSISDEDLRSSVKTYNAVRGCLKRIYEMHAADPGIITGRDMYTVMKVSMIMDRDVLLERLTLLIDELKKPSPFKTAGKKRLLLAGSICDHPDVYGILEESGGVVVWDDLCTGSRYFEGIIDEDADPVEAVANRYLERAVCPAKHLSPTERGENLVALAKKYQVEGVIFLLLKFCDPHAFDYPYLKEYLDREGIPGMLLEIEDQLPPEGQLRTRFETFVEMI